MAPIGQNLASYNLHCPQREIGPSSLLLRFYWMLNVHLPMLWLRGFRRATWFLRYLSHLFLGE